MLNTKIYKPLEEDFILGKCGSKSPNDSPSTFSKYSELAQWCNANNAMIVDRGDYYEAVAVPAPTTEELAAQARSQRDALIAATDYLVASDYPLTDEKRQELTVYRQALRDVPEQPGFPTEIVWPVKPEWVK